MGYVDFKDLEKGDVVVNINTIKARLFDSLLEKAEEESIMVARILAYGEVIKILEKYAIE